MAYVLVGQSTRGVGARREVEMNGEVRGMDEKCLCLGESTGRMLGIVEANC